LTVSPVTASGAGNCSSGGGFDTVSPQARPTPARFSIHGQRESDNAYYLNGASVQETIGQQAGIIPNLDSIAEFRILSSNVDAASGRPSHSNLTEPSIELTAVQKASRESVWMLPGMQWAHPRNRSGRNFHVGINLAGCWLGWRGRIPRICSLALPFR